MSNNILISIIVPVYNVERYLRRCLDSIVSQTYTNLEIILVDDGSKDSSGNICDEYAKKDIRIHVIHQANAGQSCARNKGLSQATGDVIGFVDSDDHIAPDMFDRMLESLASMNADIVNCGILRQDDNGGKKSKFDHFPVIESSSDEGMRFLLDGKIPIVPWNKLYKREVFNNIRFPEGMAYEDEYIMPYLFSQAKKIAYFDTPLYFYNERQGSTIHASLSKVDMDRLTALENHILAFAPSFPDLELKLKKKFYLACCDVFGKAVLAKSSLDTKKEIFNRLTSYLKEVTPALHGGNRLEACIAQCGYAIYYLYRVTRFRILSRKI